MAQDISKICKKHNSLHFFFFYKQNLYICEPTAWRRDGILLGKCSQLYTTVRTACSIKKEGPWNYSIYFFKQKCGETFHPDLEAFLFPECLGSSQVITTTSSSIWICIDLPHPLFLHVGLGEDGRSFSVAQAGDLTKVGIFLKHLSDLGTCLSVGLWWFMWNRDHVCTYKIPFPNFPVNSKI